MLELIKVMVQPVALERDEDGNIVGEKVGDPVALFTPEQLSQYVAELRRQIDEANQNGAQTGKPQSPGADTVQAPTGA